MTEKKSDFILAKELVSTLEIGKDAFPKPDKIPNFRKYLTDLSRKNGKLFITKTVEKELVVIRVK